MYSILIIVADIAGLLQVQQSFYAQGASDVDFWIFLAFHCLHRLRACRFVNL